MSEALKNKVTEEYQSAAKPYTLFNQNGIQIILNLPGALQLSPNSQDYYPPLESPETNAPILINNTGFDILSATFIVTLQDVIDTGNKLNTIASVQWWDKEKGQQVMEFTCGEVDNKNQVMSTPKDGFSRVRWATMANNGRGQSTLLNDVSLVSLTFRPALAPINGPIVQIG
ncbi:hypothetical protein J2W43_004520 [Pseudomonas brassicacearum]|uniref:Uncharacterized protein n=1 Tax=Pseudomonas brassicacearum TaxID=930166 RepID=A0AAW8MFQ9_9PSED|nr:hypothetical protein [Pseudomonas brassicacearum]MDR6960515.1 hypothetical protein [Pseudomonas brassicacearum]